LCGHDLDSETSATIGITVDRLEPHLDHAGQEAPAPVAVLHAEVSAAVGVIRFCTGSCNPARS